MTVCRNKGCGKEYSDDPSEVCYYHPGLPVFHDALKGWSCCQKKMTGCTEGQHSKVSLQLPVAEPKREKAAEIVVRPAIEPVAPRITEVATVPEVKKVKVQKPVSREEDLFDSPDCMIAVGEKCQRPSCGMLYSGPNSKTEICTYHAGSAIFHDATKGWSCCKKRVMEFDEFLKINGCTSGLHRFTSGVTKQGPRIVDCKRDWYQTPSQVILSFFAKQVSKEKTTVVITESYLAVDIVFENGALSTFHTDLFLPVSVGDSSFKILGTKLEITMVKKSGQSWSSLEKASVSSGCNTNI